MHIFFANMCYFTTYTPLLRIPLVSILGRTYLRLVNADCFYQVARRFSLFNSWASCTYGTRSLTTNHLQLSLKYKRSTIRAKISYPIFKGRHHFKILGKKVGILSHFQDQPPLLLLRDTPNWEKMCSLQVIWNILFFQVFSLKFSWNLTFQGV